MKNLYDTYIYFGVIFISCYVISQTTPKRNSWPSILIIIMCVIAILINYTKQETYKNRPAKYIYYFYSKKCRHCKNINPIWKKFTNTYTINKSGIFMQKIDVDKSPQKMRKYKIYAVPTILGVVNDSPIQFTKKITFENLQMFFTSLQKK